MDVRKDRLLASFQYPQILKFCESFDLLNDPFFRSWAYRPFFQKDDYLLESCGQKVYCIRFYDLFKSFFQLCSHECTWCFFRWRDREGYRPQVNDHVKVKHWQYSVCCWEVPADAWEEKEDGLVCVIEKEIYSVFVACKGFFGEVNDLLVA